MDKLFGYSDGRSIYINGFFFFFYHNGFLIDHSPKSYIAFIKKKKKKKVNWKNVYENFYVNRLIINHRDRKKKLQIYITVRDYNLFYYIVPNQDQDDTCSPYFKITNSLFMPYGNMLYFENIIIIKQKKIVNFNFSSLSIQHL